MLNKHIIARLFAVCSTALLLAACKPGIVIEPPPPGTPLFKVNLTWGITNTQYSWWNGGNTAASQAAGALLKSVASIYNVFIMGWGPGNPWPSKDAPYDFSGIKARVDLAASLGGVLWISFCTAPGWMKVAGYDSLSDTQKDAADWNMDLAPLPGNEDDFAALCAAVAKAFPQVKVFQVWNEFKGMWTAQGTLDYGRYTRLYNKVYSAVKAVRPDAQIGGFYAVLEGDGTRAVFGDLVPDSKHSAEPLIDESKEAIAYFTQNAVGLDYFLVDRSNVDYHNDGYNPDSSGTFRPSRDQAMLLTKYFQKATAEVAEMTGKPIVWSEYYGTYGDDNAAEFMPLNSQYIAAHYASIIYNMIMGAAGRDLYALLWVEQDYVIRHALFTDTNRAGGGIATPHYAAMKKLLDNFPKGTMLYSAAISSPGVSADDLGDVVEALVSDKAVLLINKTNTELRVTVNGVNYDLAPYAVDVEVLEPDNNP